MTKKSKLISIHNQGMTIPEVAFSVAMLSAFTAVFVVISQYTASFFQPMTSSLNSPAYDFLSDYNTLLIKLDKMSNILSQPGYSIEELTKLRCTGKPYHDWNLPGPDVPLTPSGYNICLKASTSMNESPLSSLISSPSKAKPGLYILYAIPVKGISGESLPVRRVFCRPQPYC